MKKRYKKADLEVDFIGGMGALTEQEEKALSDFFKKQKPNSSKVKKSSRPKHAA